VHYHKMTCQKQLGTPSVPSTSSSTRSNIPPGKMIHRDQHQIRYRLFHRLGIASRPSITMGTVRTIPKLSTNKKQHGVSIRPQQQQKHGSSMNYKVALAWSPQNCDPSTGTSRRRRRVSFEPMVAVQEIPSHHDYSTESRKLLWMGSLEIETNARRNRIEYLADGSSCQTATEENRMMRWYNDQTDQYELVHPATYWLLYQEEQDRTLLQEHGHLFVAAGNNNNNNNNNCRFSTKTMAPSSSCHSSLSPIKKSPTVTYLAGMAA
jgi:hypothetical protein